MIDAGKMTERVTFQAKSVTRNSLGEEVVTWGDVATVWAEVRPLRGREFYAANQTQQVVDVRFLIRKRTGLTVDMRLLWKSAPYDITGLIPGTGPYLGALEIMATNGLRNGLSVGDGYLPPVSGSILLQDGSLMLLESGDLILLEAA